jgi:protoporphyrinogen/coproporphyrinogen III oxidase
VPEERPIAVVGGGLAGLAAAQVLARRGRPFVLLEATDRWGGVLRTVREDGFLFEAGPDAMLTTKPDGLALLRELGLESRIVPTNPRQRTVYVARAGRLHAMPEGMLLGVPSRMGPVWRSGLFSLAGKLRLAWEPFVPRRTGAGDESIASFVRRRLGREAWERLGDPLLGGIHAGDTDRLSMEATFPRLVEQERTHGSLVRALRAASRSAGSGGSDAGGGGSSAFVSLAGGVSELVDALVARLPPDALRVSTPVVSMHPAAGGWRVETSGSGAASGSSQTLQAGAVIVALPAPRAAAMLREVDAALAEELAGIRFVSTAIVLLGYAREQVAHPLDGYGLIVPRAEGRRVTAAGFFSTKFPGRAPEGLVSLRVFLGSAHDPVTDESDETLVSTAVRDLEPYLGLRGAPVYRRVCRWPSSTPQMELGHRERVARIESRLRGLPGLLLTGAGLRGTGMPDTIADATATAVAAAELAD